MIVSPYRTSVTDAILRGERNPQPSLRNGRAKAGVAKHHQGKTDDPK